MKKLISCVLALGLALALTACGGGSDAADSAPADTGAADAAADSAADTADAAPEGFSFTHNGKTVTLGENMSDALVDLGEADSYFEAASCAFEGLDKTYTYAGFIITTYPDGDQDFINSIQLTDDSAATQEGLYIGCTEDQVRETYGEPASEMASGLSYSSGGTDLSFVLEDGKVISIEYFLQQ